MKKGGDGNENPPDETPAAAASRPPDAAGWREVVRLRRQSVVLLECSAGVGSGLLVSLDGLVVTNRHVVEQADVFMLRFHDGSKAKAVPVHTHGSRDLAVVRAAIRRDTCFDVGRHVAAEVHAGDDVIAIGHPRGLAFTATRGIVSEPHRRLPDGEYVQTDVAINPGNSGGPLLDRDGMLVGLNTSMRSDAEGLGFAIGAADVRAYVLFVIDQIRRRALRSPTDEEIAATVQRMTPADVVHAAAQASGLSQRRARAAVTGDSGDRPSAVLLQSPTGCSFQVSVSDGGTFQVCGCVAAGLTDKQLRDPKLLFQLLKWQGGLCGPCFNITGDGIYLGFRRGVEGMDVAEARDAILRVSEGLDALYRPILRLLGR